MNKALPHHFNFLAQFLVFALPLVIILLVVLVIHYKIQVNIQHQTYQKNDATNTALLKRTANNVLGGIISDLMFLAEHNQVSGIFDKINDNSRNLLVDEFVSFAKNKTVYDQIRYIDTNGREVVRVNFNGGIPISVPNELLQKKKERYYFSETLKLGKGEIYWSPFDLNVENNVIEKPIKPTIRIGTPVFNRKGIKTGIVLLNYYGNALINELITTGTNLSGDLMLLNKDGFWLISPDKKDEWGFMLNKKKSFASRYPQEWKIINQSDQGQFYSDNGLFTFTTTYPQTQHSNMSSRVNLALNSSDRLYWKILSRTPPATLDISHNKFLNEHFIPYGIIFSLALAGSLFAARLWIKHKQSEAQTEYERGFRTILEDVKLVAVSITTDEKIIFCNKYLLQLTDWAYNDVIGKNWFELFIPENHRKHCKKTIRTAVRSSSGANIDEGPIVTRDGINKLIAWNATLSFDVNDNVSIITLLGADITEQRTNEQQLLKLSRAVEQSPSTVMITDMQGNIEYINPKFTQLTGYSMDDVIGKRPNILKSGDTSTEEYKNLWKTISAGGEWRGEFHNCKKSGELYWESARISAIRNTEGEITNFLAVKEDITERKLLQDEIDKRNREIQKNKELTAVGRMANMIAHDLRNPLSSIKMGMQILEKSAQDYLGPEENELIKIGREQVKYMESILADMMSYSRPDSLNLEWLNPDKLVELAIINLGKSLEEFKIDVKTHYHPGLPTIHGDSVRLRQALSNLILNAAQATENNADKHRVSIEVQFQLTEKGPGILIEIIDNGPGIDSETLDHLFEPFVTTRAKGTGLGLAIIKRIIDQHHGEIRLEPVPGGHGTKASLILPVGPVIQDEILKETIV